MSECPTEVSRLQVWYGVVKGDNGECPRLKQTPRSMNLLGMNLTRAERSSPK